MLRAPLATVLATVALVALPGADPADAAGSCTFAAPARIAIYATVTDAAATITGDCVPDGYADWYTRGDAYAEAHYDDESTPAAILSFPDVLDAYGRQLWQAWGAGSDADCTPADCDTLTQNEPYSDIRLGGYASLSATRSGSRVTFTAGSGGWSPASHSLVVRPRIGGEIQTQYADGSWRRVGNAFTTGSNGKATVTYTLAASRTYRYAMYSTATYFDRVSTPVTR